MNLQLAYRTSGKPLNVIKYFQDSRKPRVVLNGKYSSWASTTKGMPQGSILGPLFSYLHQQPNNFTYRKTLSYLQMALLSFLLSTT